MKNVFLFLALIVFAHTSRSQVYGWGSSGTLAKWKGSNFFPDTLTSSLIKDNGTTISLGNYSAFPGTPSNYMMHLYANGLSSYTVGTDIELFNQSSSSEVKAYVGNVQNNQTNTGIDIFTAKGTYAKGANFVAQNASATNTGVSATATGGGNATGGFLSATYGTARNRGLFCNATGSLSATDNTGILVQTDAFSSSGYNFGVDIIANASVGIENHGLRAIVNSVSSATATYGIHTTIISSNPGSYAAYLDGGGSKSAMLIGDVDVEGHVVPTLACNYDLGSSAKRWRNIYLCNAPIIGSDVRLKSDVRNLEYGLDAIRKLRPVSYYMNDGSAEDRRLGLIAQEVKEVIGEIVEVGDDPDKTHGIRYSELIPVLIRAIQEQQSMIEELKKQLDKGQNVAVEKKASSAAAAGSRLYQNNPNPFGHTTEIRYFIAGMVKTAAIVLFDMNGKEVMKIGVDREGEGSVIVSAADLPAGMYLYSLVVDGLEGDTRKMILTR